MPNGGYVKENGVSVCSDCHENCEGYLNKDPNVGRNWRPEILYSLIGSSHQAAVKASEELGT